MGLSIFTPKKKKLKRIKSERQAESWMADAGTGTKRRKMGEKKEANNSKKSAATKWPNIKPKLNLQIHRLKDTDLFTVRFSFHLPFLVLFFFSPSY